MELRLYESIILFAGIALYGMSCIWALGFLVSSRIFSIRAGRILIFSAFVIHTVFLVAYGIRKWALPVATMNETFFSVTWGITLFYLYLDRTFHTPALPGFTLPLVVVMFLGAALSFKNPQLTIASRAHQFYFTVHSLCGLLSYAAFGLGFVAGLMYLLQEHELRSKKTGRIFRRLPSLETLDRISYRAVALGFPLLTFSIILGAILAQSSGLMGQHWVRQPKVLSSGVTWLAYAALIHIRLTSLVKGKKVAVMTVLAFALVLFTYVGTTLALGDVHGEEGL
jgi:ABC-type transport system involved in cytochrome c biogenesis permease subunit